MRKDIFRSVLVIICVLITIFLLEMSKEDKKNGFERNFSKFTVKQESVKELKSNNFDFIGKRYGEFVIYDWRDPALYFTIDSTFKQLKVNRLYPVPYQYYTRKSYLKINDSNGYLSIPSGDVLVFNKDGVKSYLYKGSFDYFLPVSANSLIVRSFKVIEGERRIAIAKVSMNKNIKTIKEVVLPKKRGGLFANDGKLYFDISSSSLFYVYYYKGQFLTLDTNLNIRSYNKTIDTVKNESIKLVSITSKSKSGEYITRLTPSNSPKVINKFCSSNNQFFYINSGLIADNEKRTDFKKRIVIDVYSTNTGAYLRSFYLPKYGGFNMRAFEVNNDKIYAIYDRYLVKYIFHLNTR